MCGIAGVFGSADGESVRRMIEVQAHRGPNGRGFWTDDTIPVALGHARLSIIDLSDAGHQPMSYGNGRVWITFNGEIYNHVQIRRELEQLGCAFRSHSDTEVIMAAYLRWGMACVNRFRGMFAFALVDRGIDGSDPKMFLVRDRLGIKPLVMATRRGETWFASELRGLMASGRVECVIDQDALLDYLAVGSVVQPKTMLMDVECLPPGHWMKVSAKGRELIRYWDLHESTARQRSELQSISESAAVEALRHRLEEATAHHLVADVPVGAFLSGGIDSTAVVSLMARQSATRIKTFAVGFENAYASMDERQSSRLAADFIGTEHQEIVVSEADTATIFDEVVKAIDQPSIDGTNTWIVSRAAGRHVRAAVSGLGGDELFAGYPHFTLLAEAHRHLPDGRPGQAHFWELVRRGLGPYHRFGFKRQILAASPARRFSHLRRLLADHELSAAVQPALLFQFQERLQWPATRWMRPDADEVQQTSYAEVSGYLVSTLLRDSDALSMAHSLEVRPVLLDHELAQFAYALPAALKIQGGKQKHIFVRADADCLPAELRNRRKMGFELPFTGWMKGPLRARLEALLCSRNASSIFQPAYLNTLTHSLRAGTPPRSLWAWGILLAWMEANDATISVN